jgi:hypothetical protein
VISIAGSFIFLGSPAHAQNATTTTTTPLTEFDTFYIDSAGFVYDQWSDSNWMFSEQPPAILDGLPSDTNKLVGTPAAVSDGPGRLNLFARDNSFSASTSAIIWQNIWSNNSWSENWQQVPGDFENGLLYIDCGLFTKCPYIILSDPTVSSWGPGRMDLFVYAEDNGHNLDLLHTWADNSTWSDTWENLGSVTTNPTPIQLGIHPSAVSWGSGRVDVFAHSVNNTVLHKWFDNGQWSNGWEDLGGSVLDSPSAVSWLPGFLEVFTRDTNNHLTYELYGGGFWSGWGTPTNFTLNTAPGAVAIPGSTVHVFTISGQDLLRQTDSPVGNPNGWSSDWVHYACDCLSPSSYAPTAVVWTPHLMSGTNIAPLASASASSENAGAGQQASKAIDGVINGSPNDPTKEWATINGGAGSWLQLNWSNPQSVTGIVLYDRPNLNDQITSGNIQFSDGSGLSFGSLYNSGAGGVLTFPAKTISSLRVNVTAVSGTTTNVGLAEIQVYGETLPTPTPRPPRPTPTPQPTPTRVICIHPPCKSPP